MATVMASSQEWVLEQLQWHGSGEGHDASCWRRHPGCAETYVSNLQSAITVLDSDLRRLLDGLDFEAHVEREVARRLAARKPEVKVVEKRVVTEKRDTKRDAIVDAVCMWLEALERRDELNEAYGLDEADSYLHELPDDFRAAEREVEERERAMRKAAEAYWR